MNVSTSRYGMNLYKNIKKPFAHFTRQVTRITPSTPILKAHVICPVCETDKSTKFDLEFYLKGEHSIELNLLKQGTYLNTDRICISDISQKKYMDIIQDCDKDLDDIRKLIC